MEKAETSESEMRQTPSLCKSMLNVCLVSRKANAHKCKKSWIGTVSRHHFVSVFVSLNNIFNARYHGGAHTKKKVKILKIVDTADRWNDRLPAQTIGQSRCFMRQWSMTTPKNDQCVAFLVISFLLFLLLGQLGSGFWKRNCSKDTASPFFTHGLSLVFSETQLLPRWYIVFDWLIAESESAFSQSKLKLSDLDIFAFQRGDLRFALTGQARVGRYTRYTVSAPLLSSDFLLAQSGKWLMVFTCPTGNFTCPGRSGKR